MIDREHKLPISQQAKVLGISRALPTTNQAGQPEGAGLDEPNRPFASGATLRRRPDACAICCARRAIRSARHVATLMKRMGIEALYRKPRTTKRHPGHKVYPYLLRNLPVTRANQVLGDGHTFPWPAASLTWLPLWTGLHAGAVLEGLYHHGMHLLSGGGGGGHGELRHPGR